jgi:isopentenyl phosphate kinase
VAQKYATQRGITGSESCRGIALVQEAAAKLNRIVVKALIESGVNAISIQPSGAAISENSRIVKWELDVVEKLLDCNLVPVVYGDVSIDLGQGCCILSTEEIFRHIAAKLPVERIVIGSNVNGIFDKDPNIFQDAQQIPLITPKKFDQVLCFLGKSTGIDVTGGMRSKVAALLEIVKRKNSIKCSIIDITRPKTLEDALRGRKTVGTTIQGQELRVEN